MRLLLDAHLSPERIRAALIAQGHDVLSLATDAALGALDDPEVLKLAAEQERILITRNSRDFVPLLREWAEAGRHHRGGILLWTLKHHEFGAIVDAVERSLADRPEAREWTDLTVAI